MEKLTLFLLLISSCLGQILSYKILIVVTPPAKSHYNLGKGLADILHERGHELTMISAFKNEKPKYREIYVEELIKWQEKRIGNSNFDLAKHSILNGITFLADLTPKFTDIILGSKNVKTLLNDKTEKFDLVIVEYFINDPLIALGLKYDCPVIALSSVSMMSWLAVLSSNPLAPETTPDIFQHMTSSMTFLQRIENVVILIVQELLSYFKLDPVYEEIYNKHFPDESAKVPFSEMRKKLNAVFINSHPSMGPVRPLLPNSINIGGYHISETETPPQDLQKFLDDAEDGVIYFSMGSNLKSIYLPTDVRNSILKVFGKLKQKVLWKFEADLPEKPFNVIIKNWMPQNSILAHNNTKFFISHGGLLSMTEALHFGVPILAIPIYGDQYHNALSLEKRGNGVMVKYSNLSETSLTWAINEMLTNPKYNQRAQELQRIYNDRPMKPKDLVIFYTEHVIRTKGAPHLSPPRLSRAASLLLDVFAVILLVPLLIVVIIFCACKKVCCRRNTKTEAKIVNKTKSKSQAKEKVK